MVLLLLFSTYQYDAVQHQQYVLFFCACLALPIMHPLAAISENVCPRDEVRHGMFFFVLLPPPPNLDRPCATRSGYVLVSLPNTCQRCARECSVPSARTEGPSVPTIPSSPTLYYLSPLYIVCIRRDHWRLLYAICAHFVQSEAT